MSRTLKLSTQVDCKPFPGIEPLDDETGIEYFTRVVRTLDDWMSTSLQVTIDLHPDTPLAEE